MFCHASDASLMTEVEVGNSIRVPIKKVAQLNPKIVSRTSRRNERTGYSRESSIMKYSYRIDPDFEEKSLRRKLGGREISWHY